MRELQLSKLKLRSSDLPACPQLGKETERLPEPGLSCVAFACQAMPHPQCPVSDRQIEPVIVASRDPFQFGRIPTQGICIA